MNVKLNFANAFSQETCQQLSSAPILSYASRNPVNTQYFFSGNYRYAINQALFDTLAESKQ